MVLLRLTVLAAVFLSAAAPAMAQDVYAGARYRHWLADLDGTIRADGPGVPGSELDVDGHLEVEQDGLSGASFWVIVPWLGRVEMDYGWGSFDGGTTLSGPCSFGGESFNAGDEVTSEFSFQTSTTSFEYSLELPVLIGTLRAGVRSGTMYFSLDGEVGTDVDRGSSTPDGIIPVIGASAVLFLGDAFSLEATAMLASVRNFGNFDSRILDWSAGARISYGLFFAGAGWRSWQIELSEDKDEPDESSIEFTLVGIYVEAGLRF